MLQKIELYVEVASSCVIDYCTLVYVTQRHTMHDPVSAWHTANNQVRSMTKQKQYFFQIISKLCFGQRSMLCISIQTIICQYFKSSLVSRMFHDIFGIQSKETLLRHHYVWCDFFLQKCMKFHAECLHVKYWKYWGRLIMYFSNSDDKSCFQLLEIYESQFKLYIWNFLYKQFFQKAIRLEFT